MSKNKYRVIGFVVLFNPPNDVIQNILSYLGQVDLLYAVDNSDLECAGFLRQLAELDTVRYLDNRGNPGLAHALNRGIRAAMQEGADFVLMMDQDGRAQPEMVARMMAVLDEISIDKIGIVSPFHLTMLSPSPPVVHWQTVLSTMSSGNLLRVEAYHRAGPFMEELFLDYVDNEYCLRLRQCGFLIIRVNNALLEHKIANLTISRILGWEIVHLNYLPIRWYYISRNCCYVFPKYWGAFPGTLALHGFFIIKHALFSLIFERCRWLRIKMIARGCRDYWSNRLGKFQGNESPYKG